MWSPRHRRARACDRGARAAARRVPEEARPGADARAVRGEPPGRRAPVRGPEARRAAAALRPAARDGRRAQELGGAEGAVGASPREATGRPRRGSSHRVRRLRGRDPQGQLRRRRRDRLGPRLVPPREGRGSARRARQGEARGRVLRLQDARAVDARADVGEGQGVAPPQEGGRRRRRRGTDGALPAVGPLGADHRGDPRRWREGGGHPGAARGARRAPARRVAPGPAVHARHAGAGAVLEGGLALRDEVRRRPRVRPPAGRHGGASRPERQRDHRTLPGAGGRPARAPRAALPHRRRDRRPGRGREAQLPAAPVADGAHEPARHRARGGPGAGRGDLLRLPHARPLRPAAAAAPGAEAVSRAAPALPRTGALRGPRRDRGRGLLRGGLGGAARGHRRQEGEQRIRGGPVARLAQDQVPASPGVRDRRLHRSAGLAPVLRRASRGRLRGRPPHLRLQGG